MNEPSPRASRLAVAAGLAAVIVVGGGGFLLGQRAASDRVPAPAPAPLTTPMPTPTPEAASRTLDRGALIALASIASDATARGAVRPAELDEAVGKRFSIALPFGCGGPSTDAAMRWQYDDAAGALRLHVAPMAFAPEDWSPQGMQREVEAIEAFWIARPWMGSEVCPSAEEAAAASGSDPVTLPGQTLAIGQFFSAEGARQGRRDGKPYTAVVRVASDALRAEQGFRFRVTGHIAAVPGGGAVACRQPGGAEQRPICLIAIAAEQLTIEHPISGEKLATWSAAGTRQGE